MSEILRVVFGVVLLVGMSAFIAAWIGAEIRAAIWMKTPPTDPS